MGGVIVGEDRLDDLNLSHPGHAEHPVLIHHVPVGGAHGAGAGGHGALGLQTRGGTPGGGGGGGGGRGAH